MMSQPTISHNHIAFIYAEDLWLANIDGSNPIRLTIDEGIESNPCFSPDGNLIAFSAQYYGNTDVYLVPVEGGIPTRLTWHPGDDIVEVLLLTGQMFCSFRSDRYSQTGSLNFSLFRSKEVSLSVLRSQTDIQRHIHRIVNHWPTLHYLRLITSGRITGAEGYQTCSI
jgi:hypothetical protein